MTRLAAAFLLVVSSVGAPALSAQAHGSASHSLPESAAELSLKRAPGRFRTIKVRMGRDSADYLFDTGGGITVISPQDSATIGCTPGGMGFGVRLTGEILAGRRCANVTLGVGPLQVTDDAGVVDLAKLLGPRAPSVRGIISLSSFKGRLLTVDLAHDRLILETPASFAHRVQGMRSVPMRLATGEGGDQLSAYVGARAPSGAMLWLEWDSENHASTLLAPYAIAMLGGDTTQRAADLRLTLAHGVDVTLPVQLKRNMIHDGVLSAAFLERAVWSLDLQRGLMFVGPLSPVLSLPVTVSHAVQPPQVDPVGVYEATVLVGGHQQRAIISISRVDGTLVGRSRPVGDDDDIELSDVAMRGNELSYRVMIQNPVPVRLTFDGLHGAGIWGDGGTVRGGAASSVKVE